MATVVSALITEIRYQLGDETATYHWTDVKIVKYINAGQIDIYAKRPECVTLSDTIVDVDPPATISAVTQNVDLRNEYHQALIFYVCWHCFAEDTDDDANVAQAKLHKTWYEEAVR